MFKTLFFSNLITALVVAVMGAVVLSVMASPRSVFAKTASPSSTPLEASMLATVSSASPSATATPAAQTAPEKDITETIPAFKNNLQTILDTHPVNSLSFYNPLQYFIHRAVDNGLPVNIIILVLLFPVIASVIAFSRHIIGLKGFGVYTPAVLSVAFVSTGIINGILLFALILGAAILTKKVFRKLNLQYLPRTAMLLWGVSIIVLVALIAASFIPLSSLLTINIFPLLIIILLTENFLESQLSSSQSEATQLTVETLLTATFCSLLIRSPFIQSYVILQPELTLIGVAIINLLIGRYSGLRFLEWLRFRSIID